MMIAWKKLCRTLSAFRIARGGNVAITFALATLPILGFVGAAVDYSRANSVKAAMQTSLNSTALMLSKEATTDTPDQMQQNALKYFTAIFVKPEAQNIQVTVNYTNTGGSEIVVSATAQLPADFTKIIGFDNFNLSRFIHRQVGHKPVARGARTRQHRIDGRRRQDRRAAVGDPGTAQSTPERRDQCGRRLCFDRSIRKRRERRRCELQCELDLLGDDDGSGPRPVRHHNLSWEAEPRHVQHIATT